MSTSSCKFFSLRMIASTSRTLRGVIQLSIYVLVYGFEEHQYEFTIVPGVANFPDIIENSWDHLDRVFRNILNSLMYILVHLSTALNSAWLNIPVNTFRNLTDSFPVRRYYLHCESLFYWLFTGGHILVSGLKIKN